MRVQCLRLFAIITAQFLLSRQNRGCGTAILGENQLNRRNVTIKTTNPKFPAVVTTGSKQ